MSAASARAVPALRAADTGSATEPSLLAILLRLPSVASSSVGCSSPTCCSPTGARCSTVCCATKSSAKRPSRRISIGNITPTGNSSIAPWSRPTLASPALAATRAPQQRFLDPCIFILFCEDMGRMLRYPPALLPRSVDFIEARTLHYQFRRLRPWDEMRSLFRAMRDGGNFGPHRLTASTAGSLRRTGTRFPPHPRQGLLRQGQAPISSPTANTAALFRRLQLRPQLRRGRARHQPLHPRPHFRAIDHRTRNHGGRGRRRPSINLLSKRKTDGVYYTPEWVVNTIVEQTVGARLENIKGELGFKFPAAARRGGDPEITRLHSMTNASPPHSAGAWLAFFEKYRFRSTTGA